MRVDILEEIGLTHSEIKVYLALLELGSTTTGKIVDKSKVASSKIYEILDKLMQKGLVSFIVKSGVKYFEAAPPERIMDYMTRKEKKVIEQKTELQKLLPELELKRALSKYKSEATIFKGIEGAKTAFEDVLKTLKKGDEYYVLGATTPAKPLLRFLRHYHEKRSKKGIRVKLLFTEQGRTFAERIKDLPNTQIKFAPANLFASSFALMYKDKTLITVATAKDITLFRIENKEVTDSFKSQFELLWKQETRVLRGLDAVQQIFEEMLDARHVDFIGARGYFMDQRSEYINDWEWRAKAKGFTMRNLTDSGVKGHRITKFPFAQTRYHLPKEFSNLSVLWIFGNKVVISNWMEEEPIAIVIENKRIYEMYKQQFEVLWEQK